MKLIFFLIAFSLLSIRVYFSWSGKDKEKRGESVSSMVIKSDNFYEEIKYSGKFQLTDDETGFKSISPGGYFKFRKNDESVMAESNLKGEIEYRIYDGEKNLALDEEGKKLVAEAIKEMIAWGFDVKARMERIYQKGGSSALISEIDSMKTDQIKAIYLDRVFDSDSSLPEDLPLILLKIESLGFDPDKSLFLKKISPDQLKNPETAAAYFLVIEKMGSDMDKSGSLQHILDQDSVTEENAGKILVMSAKLGSDMDKVNLYRKMISRGLISGPLFDSLLNRVSLMGSDMDKVTLYKNLLEEKSISEEQWIKLIDKTQQLGSDMDKSSLLITIAQKMPKTETVKASYLKSAKTIHNDSDYGRTLRAAE